MPVTGAVWDSTTSIRCAGHAHRRLRRRRRLQSGVVAKRSRKTTLNFATGSSIYKDFDGRHYAATGSATLDSSVRSHRPRSVSSIRAASDWSKDCSTPVFTDTVTASGWKLVVFDGSGGRPRSAMSSATSRQCERGRETATAPGPAGTVHVRRGAPRSSFQVGYTLLPAQRGRRRTIARSLTEPPAPADALTSA